MVRLLLFGGVALEDDGGPVRGGAARQHPLAILALLASAPHHTLARGKLAGTLWPDVAEETARARLNTHVYQIRCALGSDLLVSVGDELRLAAERLDCDVCRFRKAAERGDLEQAAELYRGPFLDGFRLRGSRAFEEWADRERARLRATYREALEVLAGRAREQGDGAEAVRWWRRRARDDRFDARVTLELMRALAAAGNRAGAIRVAEEHGRLLGDELGVGPNAEVRALAGRLARGEAPSGRGLPAVAARARPGGPGGVGPAAGTPPRPHVGTSADDTGGREAARSSSVGRPPGSGARTARRWPRTPAVAAVALLVAAGATAFVLRATAAAPGEGTEAVATSAAVRGPNAMTGFAPASWTDEARAYDYFRRGEAYRARVSGAYPERLRNLRLALRMFERAAARDPGFARAWERVTEVHLDLYQLTGGAEAGQLQGARRAAERTMAADHGGSLGHLARAELYRRGTLSMDRALREYEATGLSTARVLADRASVSRWLGRLEEAARLYGRARSLAPTDEALAYQSWFVYGYQRRYDRAAAVLDQVLELAPDHRTARYQRAMIPLYRDGDARAVGEAAAGTREVLWRRGDIRGALEAKPPLQLPHLELIAGLGRGLVLLSAGDTAAARAALDSARSGLMGAIERDSLPDLRPFFLSKLGLALAGLGRGQAGLEAARRGLALARARQGVVAAGGRRFDLALVQVLAGEPDAAIGTLESYLERPGVRSFRNVATHPLIAPLRDRPRFREVARRFGE